ncbi:hypothetical protein ANTRET_LOCUS5285 [Anthophora retusa]
MEAEFRKLIADRGMIKASLTRLNKYFRESSGTVSAKALQKRLEANLGLYNSYNAIQSQIEHATQGTESEAIHAADRDTFEEMYFNLVAEMESFIERSQAPSRIEERSLYLENITPQSQTIVARANPPVGLSGHRVKACTRNHCDICGKKHHKLLHRVSAPRSNTITSEEVDHSKPNTTVSCVAHSDRSSLEQVVLSTAVVYIEDKQGQKIPCRALLDSGSQSNFITHKLCKILRISYEPIEVQVSGLAGRANIIKERVNVRMTSTVNSFSANISCLAIKEITQDMPNIVLERVELSTQWSDYRQELSHLSQLKIPRRALHGAKRIELHGFADASEKAFGACVYLRSSIGSGKWKTRILCSKSRVAPLRVISLPRLELCGALLLAQLMKRVRTALRVKITTEKYWCDSTIALAWIRGDASRWKTFVANRVSQIQEMTEVNSWAHVSSEDNPADVISRGSSPKSLSNNDLWWLGPSWLSEESTHWPRSIETTIDIPEEKARPMTVTTVACNINEIFLRYSDYTRLLRITGYCLRFIKNARAGNRSDRDSPTNRGKTYLAVTELQTAQDHLIRIAQRERFHTEIDALIKETGIAKQSSLHSLAPYLDNLGIIRVGGRLSNASVPYNKRHPIVLPAKHALTNLIIKNEHNRLLHAGCQQVVASLRERFWPINCTRNVKGILRTCVKCFRAKPRAVQYPMGQLPANRVTPARPFSTCGVDYAGPFITKDRTRSKIALKYQLLQQMFQHFWKRWQREYLHHLQQRYKWKASSTEHMTKGSLVVIKDDNLPPLRWSLGRITELHQGKDGETRVVTIRTATGLYKRPTTKICILPMQ